MFRNPRLLLLAFALAAVAVLVALLAFTMVARQYGRRCRTRTDTMTSSKRARQCWGTLAIGQTSTTTASATWYPPTPNRCACSALA